jgi:putative endonuclease
MKREYYVYILTNKTNRVLYTGVTNNLQARFYQHRNGLTQGFANKYEFRKLVYYEIFSDVYTAIKREKQIKAG